MNVEAITRYLDLINKAIALGSALVALFALLLRTFGIGLSKKPPAERNPLIEFTAALGFAAFGAALGFFGLLISAVVAGFLIGASLFQQQLYDPSGIPLPPLRLADSTWITSLVSILTTLLAFGGKNQLRGLAFLGGCCFGGAVGIMVVASWLLH